MTNVEIKEDIVIIDGEPFNATQIAELVDYSLNLENTIRTIFKTGDA